MYSWKLILISFVKWAETPNYQGMDVLVPCWGVSYQNLWYDKNNLRRQTENNTDFYLHADVPMHRIGNQSWIVAETVQRFRNNIMFYAGVHHIHLQPRQDPQNQWLATEFWITEEDIETISQDWPEEWRRPVADDQISAKNETWQNGTSKNQGGYQQGEEIPWSSPYESK